jgi:hypothetical protein
MRTIFLSLVISIWSHTAFAQVGIGTTTPAASAALDITSTTKGLLVPRLTQAQRDAIATPAVGLMIYCTNCGSQGQPQFYGGSSWYNVLKGAAVLNGTTDPTDAVGSDEDFYINTSRVMLFGPKANGTWPAGVSLFGSEGPPGNDGVDGREGPPGADGADGATGAQGPQGDPGPPGADGAQGPPGNDGMPGMDGAPGPQGDPGPPGNDGMPGMDGAQGPQGDPGLLPDNGFGQNIGSMPFWDGGQWNLTSNIYNVVFNNDTFVGIGNQFPGHALDVNGTVNATSFIGDGSQVTGISVSEINILDDSITTSKIVNQNVTADKLAYNSVTTDKIEAGAVTSEKLASDSVTSSSILDLNVTESKLQDGSVSEAKLAGLSVSSIKLQDNSVTEEKILDGSISTAKIKVPQNNNPSTGDLLIVGPFSMEWQTPSGILVDLTTDQTVSGSKSFQDNVRVGTTSVTNSAALEIASTAQGFLPPRMTSTQRDDIEDPVTGLIVFCTDCGVVGQPQFYSGSSWYNMLGQAAAAPLSVGLSAFGGKIAYILQPGDPGYDANVVHGLVAAATDVSTDAMWGCFSTTITGADGSTIGTGNQNTIDILAGCSEDGIAAKLCAELSITDQDGTVYNDWYLPSKNELIKLYQNRVAITGFNTSVNYWSSTEGINQLIDAWVLNFSDGTGADIMKDVQNSIHVRAIRSF